MLDFREQVEAGDSGTSFSRPTPPSGSTVQDDEMVEI
jgi:hypothetical protein